MKLFLVALVSTLAAGEGTTSFSSLRRTAVVEGDDRENAFAKLYIDELAHEKAHMIQQKNGEVHAYYSTYKIPGVLKDCRESMDGGLSNTLDQEDVLCCSNTPGCGVEKGTAKWHRGCKEIPLQCDCDDYADAAFQDCSGLAPIDTDTEVPGEEDVFGSF